MSKGGMDKDKRRDCIPTTPPERAHRSCSRHLTPVAYCCKHACPCPTALGANPYHPNSRRQRPPRLLVLAALACGCVLDDLLLPDPGARLRPAPCPGLTATATSACPAPARNNNSDHHRNIPQTTSGPPRPPPGRCGAHPAAC